MEPTPLLLATKNPGKLREFRAALEPHGIRVLGLDTLPESGGPGVEETGSTFEENAKLKAEAYARRTDHPVLADDSGLEVDALGGEPGVHSARYGGPGLDDQQRVTRLLHNLRYVPDEQRTARFRCVLALARAGRTLATFDGTVEGTITRQPRGTQGFGYDPVFFHEPTGRTFAEIPRAQKQTLSHRGRAIEALLKALETGTVRLAPPTA